MCLIRASCPVEPPNTAMRAKVSASFNRGSIFMSKSRWEFRPTTVQRLVKTARALGLTVSGIEVGKDLIRVLVAEPDAPSLLSEGAQK